MKNILLIFFFVFLMIDIHLYGQQADKKDGNFFGTLFFDGYSQIGEGNNKTAMEIQRVYFGYQHNYSKELQASFKLDIGSPENESAYSLIRRYAYFKNAYLKYKKNNIAVNVGLVDVLMFKNQEKYWGHRYIEKSFLDRYKFGPSADIGANIQWDWKKITLDFGIYNGEGYKNLQFDNSYRAGFGFSYRPIKNLLARFYFDYSQKTITRSTYTGFLGYKIKDKIILGAEYSYQQNYNNIEGRNLYGYSAFGTWNINEKWQFLARYDVLNSNIQENDLSPWHLASDGSSIISGFQYLIHKGIAVSLNYQDWVSYASNLSDKKYVYLNLEVKF